MTVDELDASGVRKGIQRAAGPLYSVEKGLFFHLRQLWLSK